MKRPSFQFYPADWRKDPALSVCSLAARGLWIDLMCVAHEAAEYGVLSINGKPMTSAQIARTVGASQEEVDALLHELEDAGVFSRDGSGAIYSRRMVKDEKLRQVRAECGKLGGNPRLLNQELKQMDKQTDNQIPTPSSSSSSSSSSTGFPDCPHREILSLYAEKLPELPQPRIWEGDRAKNLAHRWRWVLADKKQKGKPHDVADGLDYFGGLFDYIRECDLLMGRKGGWSADLGWIVKATSFAKIIEGNYANRSAA